MIEKNEAIKSATVVMPEEFPFESAVNSALDDYLSYLEKVNIKPYKIEIDQCEKIAEIFCRHEINDFISLRELAIFKDHPISSHSWFIVSRPEIYVEKFDSAVISVIIWDDDTFSDPVRHYSDYAVEIRFVPGTEEDRESLPCDKKHICDYE
jgi:hypothetical protein